MAIQPAELLDLPYGTGLERVDPAEAAALEATGALVRHPTRARPLYFDGRFLSADDLTADQDYVRVRQAELGRALGTGIGEGLSVGLVGASRTRIRVGAGFGITPTGEVVLLEQATEVDVSDIPQIERLDVELGLRVLPTSPATGLDGAYVLALRAVEFSANPTAAYPTRLTGPRTIEDGEVIEAVAITLIPWADRGTAQLRRARLARDIFVSGFDGGLPVGALPVALLTFDAGAVVGVDTWLVRREIGAERGGLFGFGLTRRSLAEAYLRQYGDHLRNEITNRLPNTIRTATDHFQALPPVGQLPKDCVDGAALTQRFFPPEVRVGLALIPEDELASLVEERLLLPPIDLLASTDVLSTVAVDVLVPVPRAELRTKLAQIEGSNARVDLKNTTPKPVLRATPLLTLQALRARRFPVLTDGATGTELQSPWATILAAAPSLLWFARRPSFRASDLHLAERLQVPSDQQGTGFTDSDADGLSNAVENLIGTNAFFPDSDYGGVNDGLEVELGLDPLNSEDDAQVGRSEAIVKTFGIVVEPDIGQPFKLRLRELEPDPFRAELAKLMATDALTANKRLRASAWGELKDLGTVDPTAWKEFVSRYSRADAGKGVAGATVPDEIADDAAFARVAELGVGGKLDVALRARKADDRAAARELLRAWGAGEVDDQKLRASLADLTRRTP